MVVPEVIGATQVGGETPMVILIISIMLICNRCREMLNKTKQVMHVLKATLRWIKALLAIFISNTKVQARIITEHQGLERIVAITVAMVHIRAVEAVIMDLEI